MFIRMCDVQYWKSNVSNTWEIKEKLKILMTWNDLPFINTMQKTLKPFKKKFQFRGWVRKNFIPRNFKLKCIGRNKTWDISCFKKDLLEKQQSAPNTCNISPLKKIFLQNLTNAFFKYLWSILSQLFQKYSLYWYYANIIFNSKLPDYVIQHNKINPPPTI